MKRHFSANDYINLFAIFCILILTCQFSIRIFIVSSLIYNILRFSSLIFFFASLFCLYKSIKAFNKIGDFIDEAKAYSILKRYRDEHKLSNKLDDIEMVQAIDTLLEIYKDKQGGENPE